MSKYVEQIRAALVQFKTGVNATLVSFMARFPAVGIVIMAIVGFWHMYIAMFRWDSYQRTLATNSVLSVAFATAGALFSGGSFFLLLGVLMVLNVLITGGLFALLAGYESYQAIRAFSSMVKQFA